MAVVESAVIDGMGVGRASSPFSLLSQDHGIKQAFEKSSAELQEMMPQVQQRHAAPPASIQPVQQQQPPPPPRANGMRFESEGENGVVGLDGRSTVSSDSMRELEDLLKKLNPLAKEFVPPSRGEAGPPSVAGKPSKDNSRKNKNGFSTGKRRFNSRTSKAQQEEIIRRTVYVSDIDQQVTEEQLAALFITCGQVVDCRVCGDPNSVLRFAFVEFTDEEGAQAALSLGGTMLGYYPVRVLPSKTAIVPVNPTFLPRSESERQLCARTIYCTNIDKKVAQADVKLFFGSLCGEVSRLRLLGDHHHFTRIAFVEFVQRYFYKMECKPNPSTCLKALAMYASRRSINQAESAMAALNCSGAILGSLPIRVSPSKTPVRPRTPRPPVL